MVVNQQVLTSIKTGFKAIFQRAFDNAKPMWDKVATLVPSDTGEETYAWLGSIPTMREWIGDRQIQNLSAAEYTVKNKDFELTIGVDRNNIEDDKLGIYAPMVETIGESTATFPDELVFGLLKKGFTAKCYDGLSFFNTDHKVGKKPVSNKGTKVLTPNTYTEARTAIMSFTDEKGKSLNLVPNLLIVSPKNEAMARKILMADQIDGTTNTLKGTAELLVVPHLAGEGEDGWYLGCTNKPLKPLIYQRRKEPKFQSFTNENDQNVFMNKQFLYGVDGRSNAGFGFWQMMYGSTGVDADA